MRDSSKKFWGHGYGRVSNKKPPEYGLFGPEHAMSVRHLALEAVTTKQTYNKKS